MSWSFSAIGTPEKIAEAIEAESARLSGQCKIEFDGAKDHLIALAKENFDKPGSPVLIKLQASGHGSAVNGEQRDRTIGVQIERFSANVLI